MSDLECVHCWAAQKCVSILCVTTINKFQLTCAVQQNFVDLQTPTCSWTHRHYLALRIEYLELQEVKDYTVEEGWILVDLVCINLTPQDLRLSWMANSDSADYTAAAADDVVSEMKNLWASADRMFRWIWILLLCLLVLKSRQRHVIILTTLGKALTRAKG